LFFNQERGVEAEKRTPRKRSLNLDLNIGDAMRKVNEKQGF
tara:strand:- start:433 stop:555 length:123 start_codon:yes stop_codon:yes gene_type:complete